jgi:hypothetical protein
MCGSGFGMRSPTRLAAVRFAVLAAAAWGFEGGRVLGQASLPAILSSVNLRPGPAFEVRIGISPGVTATPDRVVVRRIIDSRQPSLEIYWDPPLAVPHYALPPGARIFAWERWTQAPVLAGWRENGAAILWLAADPGPKGFERYPYLLQALGDLGIEPPARGNDLWAFFDSSYRLRADKRELTRRWAASGISAIHVAAWHYFEPDAERDAWLRELIAICHERAILIYAWIELPHVSEKFWQDHPAWREQTALLGDAHLDWRKLMNLQHPDCVRAVERGLADLAGRFDWDGINLGELYFESLEGASNPARLTPMNGQVRDRFQRLAGADPLDLFRPDLAAKDRPGPVLLRRFLDFRAELAREMQEHWLGVLANLRRQQPHLDLVLTHVDDRFDTQMRDLLGADAAATLPLLDRFDFTFLIEDPATIWHLGPQRYPEIARRYAPLTARQDRLAIDLNIVERYQDVYPTKQQTGVELFQLVHLASAAFARVAVYFENSILTPDADWLAAAAAVVPRHEREGRDLLVSAAKPARIRWDGPATVDGKPWPLYDGQFVMIPAGEHRIGPGRAVPAVSVFNGHLLGAESREKGVEIEYESRARV